MSATSEASYCRVKLNWSVLNWRLFPEFISHVNDMTKMEAFYSPKFTTQNAGDWKLQLVFTAVFCFKDGPAHSRNLYVGLQKLSTQGVAKQAHVTGTLKIRSKSHSPNPDFDSWKQQIVLNRLLADDDGFSVDLGRLEHLPDSLDITAAFNVSGLSPVAHSNPRNPDESQCSPCSLSQDLGDLLRDSDFYDVTISIGGRSFRAHAAVLAARSPVLAARLRTSFESSERVLLLEDVSSAAWSVFQWFLYTGTLVVEDRCVLELFPELFEMSVHFDVASIRPHLEEAIVRKLSRENALQIYRQVDVFEAPKVKKAVTDVLLQNWQLMDEGCRREVSKISSLSALLFKDLKA